MEQLYKHTKRLQVAREEQAAEVAQLRAENEKLSRNEAECQSALADLRARVAKLETNPQDTLQTGCGSVIAIQGDHAQVDNSQNITVNQTINVFGREQVGHISQAQVYSLLMKTKGLAITDAAAQAVLEAALLIYSDPAHPENITCYLPNKKTNEALVHGDQGWNIQPVDLVLTPMMQKSIDVLFTKQPFGGEEGLPAEPNISACGITLKGLMEFEKDPTQKRRMAGKEGQLRAVLIRNKDELKRALNTLPLSGSQRNQEVPAALQAIGQPEAVA